MDEGYFADRLRPEEARAAFALVTLRLPNLAIADWVRDVRRKSVSRSRSGFIAVRDVRGTFHAIYQYRTSPAHGKAQWLEISEPIIANLPGGPIENAVARSIERLAADNACSEISVNLIVRAAKGGRLGVSVLEAARAASGAVRRPSEK